MSGILQTLFLGAAAAVKDAYFNLVTLLLPGNGTNGAQNNTFLDSSTNNFTITRNGNTTQGTFSPFSQTGWSNYFGGSGNYLQGDIPMLGTASTSTFTIEFWFYPTSFSAESSIIGDVTPTGGTDYISVRVNTTGNPFLTWYDGATKQCVSSTTITLNAWNYVAITCSSNSLSIYVNSSTPASLTGTTTLTTRTGTTNYSLGQYNSGTRITNGYLSNVRVSSIARTISSVPTSSFSNDANTRILTCQSNNFSVLGVSSTITATAVSVQAFSPFAPTAAYSSSVVGGSGYFDGSGDYLSIANSTAFDFGSGDFTVETWWYPTSISANQNILAKWWTGGSQWVLQWRSAGNFRFAWNSSSTADYSGSPQVNAWNYIAVVKSGSSLYFYLNGTRNATVGTIGSLTATTDPLTVGQFGNSSTEYLSGYISGTRITKGGALYTASTMTVPTAPSTTSVSAGTVSGLLNYTNAGITDATAKNDLETVGNAQISTTQSKFGGSSMYFDGTGDWLFINPNQLIPLGSGDFTVEMWMYPNATYSGTFAGLLDSRTSGDGAGLVYFGYTGTANQIGWKDNTTNVVTGSVTQSAWNHVAVVRASGTMKLYINGSLASSGANSTNYTVSFKYIATSFDPFSFNGYIDDLRITKGYARYSGSTYTVPAAAFPLQ